MRALLFAFFITLTVLSPAVAQDTPTILDLQPGQTVIDLSASASREVEQDLLTARLRFEVKDSDPVAAQDRLNEVMADAVSRAKETNGMKVQTLAYRIYDRTDQDERRRAKLENREPRPTWHAEQTMQIESKEYDALLKLTGSLQEDGLLLQGLNYSLSPEQYEKVHNSLLEEALEKLRVKAERAANALGKSTVEIRHVVIGSDGYSPRPVMRSHMLMAEDASAGMQAPTASAGESTVSLSVSSKVLLSP